MIQELHKRYNDSFTKEKYQQFLNDLDSRYPGAIEFRVAETPVFVDKNFYQKILEACESIVDIIIDPSFK